MLLIILLIFALVVGIILFGVSIKFNRMVDDASWIMTLIIIALVTSLITIPISRHIGEMEIIKFKEAQRTIENQRQKEGISEIERAALTNEIIKYNTWLQTNKKISNSKWISIYMPKEINELRPIE